MEPKGFRRKLTPILSALLRLLDGPRSGARASGWRLQPGLFRQTKSAMHKQHNAS
jgi:hypothetical protein